MFGRFWFKNEIVSNISKKCWEIKGNYRRPQSKSWDPLFLGHATMASCELGLMLTLWGGAGVDWGGWG